MAMSVVTLNAFASDVNLFNNFSIEHEGRTYTFPSSLGAVQDESYSGYAYNHNVYGPYVETIFWKLPPEDENGWLPTENGFLELSFDYKESGENGNPEYVVGFSFSKDPANPYPNGERIHGYLTGPSLDNLNGVVRNWDHNVLGFYDETPINLNIAQYLTEDGRNFLSNTNNYINSGTGRGALVSDWEEHGIISSSNHAFSEEAKKLNQSLIYQEGQWSPQK